MRIISFIEEPDVIKDILLHLNLWVVRNHDPPVDKLVKNIPDKTEFFINTDFASAAICIGNLDLPRVESGFNLKSFAGITVIGFI